MLGHKASISASYFNIIMGLFQVASIIELFFVLGAIQQAAVDKTGEPEQVSVLGITLTYLSASLASLLTLILMIYLLV